MDKLRIIVEGNIGSGKTTCLDYLEKMDNIEVVREPVDVWCQIKGSNGKNLLQEFYEEPTKYAYLFQSMVFKTRLKAVEQIQKKPIRFCERSIWTDRYVFGKACIRSGKMNDLESYCYHYWFDWLEEKFFEKPHAIIYIRCSPQKCLERMKKRGRQEEDGVPIEYLQELHNNHEEWFQSWTQTPCLIIDNEEDNQWENILTNITNFVSEIKNKKCLDK